MKHIIGIIAVTAIITVSPMEISASSYVATPDYIEEEMYCDQLEELAILVMAEAGNQSFEGKRWVAAVGLNRVEDSRFPDNIHDVIFQKNPVQFSCTVDGGYEKACWNVTQDCYDAVAAELENRSTDALFFRTGHYHKGTTPIKQVEAHFFSR